MMVKNLKRAKSPYRSFVQTDMGNAGAKLFGVEQAPTSIDGSVGGLVKLIDNTTREETLGRFQASEGGELAWSITGIGMPPISP